MKDSNIHDADDADDLDSHPSSLVFYNLGRSMHGLSFAFTASDPQDMTSGPIRDADKTMKQVGPQIDGRQR